MRQVYLDNAATTQVHDEVISKINDVLKNSFGNPSSVHSYGRSSKSIIEDARKTVAKLLHAHPSEICFTSGGTEADNLILNSAIRDLGVRRIITSKIEHHAVLTSIAHLQECFSVEVAHVKLDKNGGIDMKHLEELLTIDKGLTLVSLMHVNNEIGNISDITAIGEMCNRNAALFHSDTVQSVGHFDLDLSEIPVDFITASAHKFHGPKGVGFCYIRKNKNIKPLIFGGAQERGNRAGTESTHNIAGLEAALQSAYKNLEKDSEYILSLKSYFISLLEKHIPEVAFNGYSKDASKSTYTLVNVRLPLTAKEAQLLLFELNIKGIACSTGSACQSGNGSHVLNTILSKEELLQPSLRFSFSTYNTKEDLDYVVGVLTDYIETNKKSTVLS
jgi:cysteine desulfurase